MKSFNEYITENGPIIPSLVISSLSSSMEYVQETELEGETTEEIEDMSTPI